MENGDGLLAGKCECGAVGYTVPDEFRYSMNCHCSRCRAATGSAFKAMAGIERDKLEVADGALAPDRRRRRAERHALRGLRLAALLGGAGRRIRARRARLARGRPEHPADAPHLRRVEGALVRDHRRPAAVRGARTMSASLAERRRDHAVRGRPGAVEGVLRAGVRPDGDLRGRELGRVQVREHDREPAGETCGPRADRAGDGRLARRGVELPADDLGRRRGRGLRGAGGRAA